MQQQPAVTIERSCRQFLGAIFPALLLSATAFGETAATPAETSNTTTNREIIIGDFSQCEPRKALTRRGNERGVWMLADYETDEKTPVRGTLIYGAERLDSPPLSLPLNAPEGWYRISVGMWHDIHMGGSHLRLRLDKDRYYQQLGIEEFAPKDGASSEGRVGPTDIGESFWRVAYLRPDSKLLIDRVRRWSTLTVTKACSDPGACLAWVRLTPATEFDREIYFGRGRTKRPAPVFAQYDNGNWFQIGCRNADDIRASLEWFRDTDISSVLWGCYTSEGACYPTKFAEAMGREPEVTDCIKGLWRQGVDPLAVAADHALSIGVKLYPSFRIGGKRPQPALATANETPFLDAHPEYLCRTLDGTPTPHYSFAYPEVRRHFVDLACDVVKRYPVPGVHFVFCRSNPFVLYESKPVEDFIREYGDDPRNLKEDDSRWLDHKAEYLSAFVKELREALDAARPGATQRIEIAVSVPANMQQAREWGVSGADWARNRWIDQLIVYDSGYAGIKDVEDYRRALAGLNFPLIVDLLPRRMPARERLKQAAGYYAAGADGFCLWDSQGRVVRPSEFAVTRWLGHRDDLDAWADKDVPKFRCVPLRTLQGFSVDPRYWTLTSG